MAEDYGIKISKAGYDVKTVPSETNKKNFIILDSADAHKLLYAGYVSATRCTHSLGYVPYFFVFAVDSVVSPTAFTRTIRGVYADTTSIGGISDPSYIMIFYRSV